MKTTPSTIRGSPERLDRAAKRQVKTLHRNSNAFLPDGLLKGIELSTEKVIHHDLDCLAGTWVNDPAVDVAMEAFELIDAG